MFFCLSLGIIVLFREPSKRTLISPGKRLSSIRITDLITSLQSAAEEQRYTRKTPGSELFDGKAGFMGNKSWVWVKKGRKKERKQSVKQDCCRRFRWERAQNSADTEICWLSAGWGSLFSESIL